ncbi:YsnF/AvaK domain-containing protein [Leptolyngbya sp. FACHB-36]|uniref:DUF2382 domain-containing protein n=1 Tax=Leptolyngbya sp. FACHB-36 TaxID=2692808 RepID=UPI0016801B95|nr:DUF2382 domain-containing protein [Leptolyngbya sp. FACHB-36]MBD2019840.1 YsnF/AvaK domain-containing protein [Leptolyngbya sp. FACHB-36]
MALYRIKDFDPNYRDHFDGDDVKGLDLYSGSERIGSVDDVLVDDDGRFRYLVINTGAWIFGKKVLLPIGRARIDYSARRVYADNLSRQQAENLPEFSSDMATADYDYEERVRGVYRPGATSTSTLGGNAALDATAGLDSPTPLDATATSATYNTAAPTPVDATMADASYSRDTYTYDREPELYNLNDRDHSSLRLYEERLIANKRREKTGEVAVGKRVETETARVSVPIEKERVVIERTTPANAGTAIPATDAAFNNTEVARVEVYEETPDIHKEAFVREEVRVKKVVEQDTVNAEEQIRREEIDIRTEGHPVVDRPGDIR